LTGNFRPKYSKIQQKMAGKSPTRVL
jgi:hypothetical protein